MITKLNYEFPQHYRLSQVAIFDLDGCVSDDEWRLGLIKDGARDGDAHDKFEDYHLHLLNDRPLNCGAELLRLAVRTGVKIVFITARPENHYLNTKLWFEKRFGFVEKVEYLLYMRLKGDTRTSVELKRDAIRKVKSEARGNGMEIVAAFDDRQDVIEMYQEEGIYAAVLDSKSKYLGNNGISGYRNEEQNETVHVPFGIVQSMLSSAKFDFKKKVDMLSRTTKEPAGNIAIPEPLTAKVRCTEDILEAAAATFRERNAVYGSSSIKVGQVMSILFPNGYTCRTDADHRMMDHFNRVIAKLVRFVNSDLTHEDSIHDLCVYAAMCETVAKEHSINCNPNGSEKA